MKRDEPPFRSSERWAHFRFSVIGGLWAAPPLRGQLHVLLEELAAKKWRHPIGGHWFSLGLSTIERWYYKAFDAREGPVEVLKRKIRSDHGQHPALSAALVGQLTEQYRQHPSWSYQLHADNLAARIQKDPALGPKPSYASVLRFMKSHGLCKRPRRGPVHSPGGQAAEARFEAREVRSFENPYVNGLWHLDFHQGSRRVLRPSGQWSVPLLLGILDDHSRLCCHAQWYLAEGAEELCHGLSQAFQKRQLPRSLLVDNGSAMVAAETQQGLTRLSVVAENTLPYSPYQNGKQESFWGQIEGRLLPMLEGVADLSLDQLNEATLAWIEMEYHRKVHSQTEQTPLERYLNDKEVGRPCPDTEQVRLAFTAEVTRTQRRSDGSFSLEGLRFEVPSRYAHFGKLTVRYAPADPAAIRRDRPASGLPAQTREPRMNKKLLNLYGLKFNPFAQNVPAAALMATPPIENFCWRIQQQIGEGGFALTTGDPGSGKSAALRILAERLNGVPDLCVGLLTRPQANLADFYRELGHLFGVPLSPHNRWNSSKVLREKWLAHIDASVHRPVLLIDEAQEMNASVLCELRLETHSPKQLQDCLAHLLKAAGNPKLLTPSLLSTLCEHAAGNLRLLMNLANDLLAAACHQERELLDEKLYFEIFALDPKPTPKHPTS